MNYAVLGPGGALTNNSAKNNARHLVKNTVLNSYFNGEWRNRNRSQNYSVWNTNGKMVGFALMQQKKVPKSKKIMLIGTSQGRGIGRILMNRIVNNARNNKYKHIVLNSVTTAEAFYKKFGFQVVNKNNNHIYMVLNLSHSPPIKRVSPPRRASPSPPRRASPSPNRKSPSPPRRASPSPKRVLRRSTRIASRKT
jgi:GNAT superfamily N-acetyltransferase